MKTGELRPQAWCLAAWAVVVILGTLQPLLREANSDEAWLLYLAQRLLEGQKQGLDFLEVNPPLSIWLMLPVTIVSRATAASSWALWVLLIAVVALGALFLTARLLASLIPVRDQRLGLLLMAGFAFLVLPRLEFSEREHLALVLTLPFVVLTAARAAGTSAHRAEALLAGLLGGIGFSLKPHFLVPWLLLEGFLLYRLRWRSLVRSELVTLVAFGMAYAAAVLVLVPAYVPMALRLAPIYHTYINNGLLGALGNPYLLFIGAVTAAFRVARPRPDHLRDGLTIAFLGFFLSAVLQQKGFSYHYLAALGYGLLLLARMWQTRPSRLNWYPSGVILRLGFVLLAGIPLLSVVDAGRELVDPGNPIYRLDLSYPRLLPRVRELARGESIAVFSSNPNSGWPLTFEVEGRWAFRYMSLWPLAALYDEQIWARPPRLITPRAFGKRTGFERRFNDEVMEDLQRTRPRLLVVLTPDKDDPGWGGTRRIDYLEYFSSDPRFTAFLDSYREVSRVGTYSLWLRTLE